MGEAESRLNAWVSLHKKTRNSPFPAWHLQAFSKTSEKTSHIKLRTSPEKSEFYHLETYESFRNNLVISTEGKKQKRKSIGKAHTM